MSQLRSARVWRRRQQGRLWCRRSALTLCLLAVTGSGEPTELPRFYLASARRPGTLIDQVAWQGLSESERAAAIPFRPPRDVARPAEPGIVEPVPFVLSGAPSDRDALAAVALGLRQSLTGRRLTACVAGHFSADPAAPRSVSLALAHMGVLGDRARTSGTPPAYLITLNLDFLAPFGPEGLVPKLAHELVHVRDYDRGAASGLALEISAMAADAAVAYEAGTTSGQGPISPYSTLSSLRALYLLRYVPLAGAPTPASYAGYWRDLYTVTTFERNYHHFYADAGGNTRWNSPPGAATSHTYVPYDPALAWPEAPP